MEIYQKKILTNVKEGGRSQVRVPGEQCLFPLFLRKHAIHSLPSRLGTMGRITVPSKACTPLARHPVRRCPARDQAYLLLWHGLGSRAAWRPLAHWRASYPVDRGFDRIQIFTAWGARQQAQRPFWVRVFALIFIHGRCQHFFLPHNTKQNYRHKSWWDTKSWGEMEPGSSRGEKQSECVCTACCAATGPVFQVLGLDGVAPQSR